MKEAGLTAHRLSGSGMVRRVPNTQMPPSRLLNCRIGRVGRPPMDVVSTVLNVAASAVSAAEASALPFGAGAIAPPLSLAGSGLGSRLGSFCALLRPFWNASSLEGVSASANDRTISPRPGTGARAFSTPHQRDAGATSKR